MKQQKIINNIFDPDLHIGFFKQLRRRSGIISPAHRRDASPEIYCNELVCKKLKDGDVVIYEINKHNEPIIRDVLSSIEDGRVYSWLAIFYHKLLVDFSPEALKIAKNATMVELGNRTDLRNLDLVTIDGKDAKDFDDAVWAAPDTEDPHNIGGWRLVVAIADVSHYVPIGSPLDEEARARGNSVYFVDRVLPMLPEALSNDLCSLKPNVDRACLAVDMRISANGKLMSYRFKRAIMRSRARLNYDQVQDAIEGRYDEQTKQLWEDVLKPLYGAYKSLRSARVQRGTLELDVPEYGVSLNSEFDVSEINRRQRFHSHELIEEMMIAANVAAAKTLHAKNYPTLYRVHDRPSPARIMDILTMLKQLKLDVPKKMPAANQYVNFFKTILAHTKDTENASIIHELVLRSQAQAHYSPHNIGHFGLGLTHYCHFTSPIRRYADLIVHRCLVDALELPDAEQNRKQSFREHQDGQPLYSLYQLTVIGEHISQTERTSADAERDVRERFTLKYLSTLPPQQFHGLIRGCNQSGLFVALDHFGVDGFLPRQFLTGDQFYYDRNSNCLVGRRTRRIYQVGIPMQVTIDRIDASTSSLIVMPAFRRTPERGKRWRR